MLLIAVCEMWEIRPLNYKSIPFGQAHLFLHKLPDPKQEMTSHQLVIFQLNRHFLLNLFFYFFFLPSIPAKTLIPPPSLSFSLPPSPSFFCLRRIDRNLGISVDVISFSCWLFVVPLLSHGLHLLFEFPVISGSNVPSNFCSC